MIIHDGIPVTLRVFTGNEQPRGLTEHEWFTRVEWEDYIFTADDYAEHHSEIIDQIIAVSKGWT